VINKLCQGKIWGLILHNIIFITLIIIYGIYNIIIYNTICSIIMYLQTPLPVVRKRTIPTERPPLVGEI
jgi:hypothetical protein